MNRGILTLSAEQREVLFKLCTQFSETATPELVTRLQAAAHMVDTQTTAQQVGLELSEDSAEAALDLLPLPSDEEPSVITDLRESFLGFLRDLRGASE